MKSTKWMRWAPLLGLAGILASCQPAVTGPAGGAASPDPAPAGQPEPAAPQATCGDLAIRLLERGAGIHGAIVADVLHMGGAAAPVTCAEPANLSLLARLSIPDDYTAQVQQSQYYLIVIRYPGGNRLYVISRRSDGTSCVVDTNDRCIAQVTELPDGFDLDDLPEDVAPTIPAGRPAPATPDEPATPPATAPAAAADPQPRDGATGVAVETLLLSWSAADRAASYEVYWGREKHLAADADLGTPLATTSTATTIRRPALGTTYYWRVDAKNDQGTTTGSVWSFKTTDQAAPPPPGGGYTPPVVSPPPAEPPPAEEPPPAGPPQPAVAPAWPGRAQSFEWVFGRPNYLRKGVKWVDGNAPVFVAAPTGTPTPVVTTSPMPAGVGFDLRNGRYYFSSLSSGRWLRRGEGVITLTATNSAGTAETTVSYAVSCHSSDAVIADWLKGSAWEPIRPIPTSRWYPGYIYMWDGNSNYPLRRAVFNDSGNGLTVTARTGGTERLTGGVRTDKCNEIKGDGWSFEWSHRDLDEVEGSDFQCDGRGGTKVGYWLNHDVHGHGTMRAAACSDVITPCVFCN